MKRLVLRLSFILSVAVLTVLPPVSSDAEQARNVAEFCGVWERVCNRTCPAGPGNCRGECAARATGCRSSGCFHFNRPGPRCFSNASDRALTDTRRAPNPQQERARRARQQN